MSSIFNTVLLGGASEVMDVLADRELTTQELHAALHNAFSKIVQLEKAVKQIQENVHTHAPSI